MRLSIVSTLYQSSRYVEKFISRCTRAARAITEDYEIILVNDGSPDDSLDKAVALVKDNPRLTVVDLSRNFGHHKAMMTGLSYAKGQRVFLLDSDLEEEPQWLERFDATMRETGADVVYGVQAKRRGRWLENTGAKIFYWAVNLLSDCKVPANLMTARLMTRRYVDDLLRHKDQELFIAGLWVITGYDQIGIELDKHDRSPTTYCIRRRINNLINGITSFSQRPLIGIFYAGILILLFSMIYAGWIFFRSVFFKIPVPGYSSLMISILFLGGLIVFFQGIMAIYLAKVFSESKNWPYTIVREVYRHEHSTQPHDPQQNTVEYSSHS
jgi:putative glycosyltransferase